jgi:zinc transporter 1/2/3
VPPIAGLHQPAESVALLVALVKAGLPKRRVALLLGCFSAVGLVGLGGGLLAKEAAGGAVEPLLVALTAGTFLYVAATEVSRH